MTKRATEQARRQDESEAAALEAARVLAHALAESPAYRKFETAQELFQADETAQQKLEAFESKQLELRRVAAWGGASRKEQKALEDEWRSLIAIPSLGAYLRAQEALTASFRESARVISDAMGVDFGAVCSPSGGCC